jgi:hypothetical protein
MNRCPHKLPGCSELAELPPSELLAFAAYCARLVLPLVEPVSQACARRWIRDAEETVRTRQPQGEENSRGCPSPTAPPERALLAARLCSVAASGCDRLTPNLVCNVLDLVAKAEPTMIPVMCAMFEQLRSSALRSALTRPVESSRMTSMRATESDPHRQDVNNHDSTTPAGAGSDWANSIQKVAWEAFVRDFDELLRTYSRKWVAYRGSERVFVGDRKSDVYVECLRRGFPADELLVKKIEPAAIEDDFEVFLPPVPVDEIPDDQPSQALPPA